MGWILPCMIRIFLIRCPTVEALIMHRNPIHQNLKAVRAFFIGYAEKAGDLVKSPVFLIS